MITKVLVANRGEIAVRVFQTAARMGIGTVAVFSDTDRNALFVSVADEAVALGGDTAAESYLRGDAVIAAAKSVGADAIHPGYGFLSENAAFAQSVIDAGLIWVGPPPSAIEVMGSKLASKDLVAAAGVPILASTDVTTGDATSAAETIGYPVLIKASAGGGGKGMRIVTATADLDDAVAGAKREAAAAFGDDTVFLEKYVTAPRHIEIQIFADHTGTAHSLFERECSIQRRHQKIIEESPSPAIDDPTRAAMGQAAIEAAEAVGYVGAGTVEFLYDEGEFWFLEMNTRLQVEHPVTELVTGLDLVELQLLTAMGEDLPSSVAEASISGHAIEARLYAEDPLNDYLPVTGVLSRFDVPPTVRLDTGVGTGSAVSVHYDPMLAKVIAHAPDRGGAARALADALRRSTISGLVTNRDLLVGILEHPEFLAGEIDTHFLERHPPEDLQRPLLDPAQIREAAIAAALDASIARRATAPTLRTIPSGWRNNPSAPQESEFAVTGSTDPVVVRYSAVGPNTFLIHGDEGTLTASFSRSHDDPSAQATLEIAGHLMHPRLEWTGSVAHVVTGDGAVDLTLLPRFSPPKIDVDPGSLHSPMPGKILQVLAEEGSDVAQGQALIIMEAMKMEHTLRAPSDGVLSKLVVAVGDQVDAATVLAIVTDPRGEA